MIDIASAYNRYRFLGHEFLTWIWFCIDNQETILNQCDQDLVSLEIGNRMVLENRLSSGIETISISGDASGLEEAVLALQKGALVTELNLVYKSGASQWSFTIKGESLAFSGLKQPESGSPQNESDREAILLEKIYFFEKIFNFIQKIYLVFVRNRLSPQWMTTQGQMKKWLES